MNVRSNLFKDFSRGYAYGYGYGYGYAKAGSNQISKMTAKAYNGNQLSGSGGEPAFIFTERTGVYSTSYPNAPVWEFTYGSGTSGSDKESTKNQEVVKYDFYTIPFCRVY